MERIIPYANQQVATLFVSDIPHHWRIGRSITTTTTTRREMVQQLSDGEVLIKVAYCGLSTVDRDSTYPVEYESTLVMVQNTLEIIGTIIEVGPDVGEEFRSGVFVAGFDLRKFGISSHVVMNVSKLVVIPTLEKKLLCALSPMLVAQQVVHSFLQNLPTGSLILVNQCTSGIGQMVCQLATRKGHVVHGIAHSEVARSQARFCARTAAAPMIVGNVAKGHIDSMSQVGYDVVITPSIMSMDNHQVYEYFGSLLKKYTGKLLYLSKANCLLFANQMAEPYEVNKFAVVHQWHFLNGYDSFNASIQQNVQQLLGGDDVQSVLSNGPIVGTRDNPLTQRNLKKAYLDLFKGTVVGKAYLEFDQQ